MPQGDYLTPLYTIYDLGYSRTLTKDDSFYDELAKQQSRVESPVNPANFMSGGSVANLYIADSELQSENFVSGVSGWKLGPTSSEFIDVIVSGTLLAGQIHIPDQDTTANSFHVQGDGDTWWGATESNFNSDPTNATAYILKTGEVWFTTGKIGGTVLGTNYIQSDGFTSGALGTGWQISSAGSAEFLDVSVRGVLRAVTFEQDTISAVSGGVLVAQGSDTLATDMTAADASTVTISGAITLAVGDIIRIKEGSDDEWMTITDDASAPTYSVDRDEGGSYTADNNPIWTSGTTVVNYGQSGDGGLYLTASESNAPYLSVFTHAGAPWTTITTRLRIGNLNGYLGYASDIYGVGIGSSSGTDANITIDPTNGIRLRNGTTDKLIFDNAGNATFSGAIIAGTLDIGGADASSFHVDSSGNLWSGASTYAAAPFKVSSGGTLQASAATITGTINATAGTFSGSITVSGTLTGGTFRTSASGKRVVMEDDVIDVYNSGGTLTGSLSGSTVGGVASGFNFTAGSLDFLALNDTNLGYNITFAGGAVLVDTGDLTLTTYSTTQTNGHIKLVPDSGKDILLWPGRYIIATNDLIPSTDGQMSLGISSYGMKGLYLQTRSSSPGDADGVFWFSSGSPSELIIRGGSTNYTIDKTAISDLRFKDIVGPSLGLDWLMQLNTVEFKYKESKEVDNGKTHYGLIAQDLLALLPEKNGIVKSVPEGESSYYAVDYKALVPILIKSIQELKAQLDAI